MALPSPAMDEAAGPTARGTGGALAGLKVVDLSRVLAGPYCTQMLADHGADVVKVEPPAGDETRDWGPPFRDGVSAYFTGLNRGKRGIAVDLSTDAGREVVRRLLEGADVVVENFKAGTMERWGLGHEELAVALPRLVYCRVTGFGADGPMGGRPGYDAVLQAYGGIMSLNGEPEGDPLRLPVPVVDLTTGMLAFSGILLALVERARSGRGQLVDCALLDSAVSLLHPQGNNWLMDGVPPRRTGSAHPSVVPYDTFATASGPLFVGVGNDRQFARLCEHLGAPGLAADPRFRGNAERIAHREELTAELGRLLADRDGAEASAALLAGGVPAAPVQDVPAVLTDPQVLHREMVVELDGYRGLGVPVKLARTPGGARSAPPRFGTDVDAVLAEAGYSPAEAHTLVASGAVVRERRSGARPAPG